MSTSEYDEDDIRRKFASDRKESNERWLNFNRITPIIFKDGKYRIDEDLIFEDSIHTSVDLEASKQPIDPICLIHNHKQRTKVITRTGLESENEKDHAKAMKNSPQ